MFDINFEKLSKLDINASELRSNNVIDEESLKKIILKLQECKNCDETEALALISGLMQKGGSNKNATNLTRFEFGGHILSAQELQSLVTSIKPRATNRQLARSLATEIAEIAEVLGIEGDLANQMRYEFPDLRSHHAVWCSNFQTTNPDCPDIVRNWLVNNYRARFNK